MARPPFWTAATVMAIDRRAADLVAGCLNDCHRARERLIAAGLGTRADPLSVCVEKALTHVRALEAECGVADDEGSDP